MPNITTNHAITYTNYILQFPEPCFDIVPLPSIISSSIALRAVAALPIPRLWTNITTTLNFIVLEPVPPNVINFKKATINKHNAHFSEPINCKEKLCITPTEWQSNEATFHLVSLCSRRDRQRDQNVGRGAARSCGKWEEAFWNFLAALPHTHAKKIPPATQAITSGVSSRAYHLSHALYFLCPLLKAFPGSITVIKLTT